MRTVWIGAKALVLMTGFLLFWGWVAWSMRVFDGHFGFQLPAWTRGAGIPIMFAGGILGLLCVGMFIVEGRGTPAPFDAPKEFVAAGPYKHARNPMYVGGAALLAGYALFEHSPSMLVFSLAWLLIVHLLVLRLEEPGLRKKFGASYEEYCRAVPRWLPRL